ncbi:hypothetical protein E2C01_075530 [Portunus trituberculatus]|uniref:Uncharacterized protein n=1 Tax=Portunus trituberculatus TaxID=210409 RepID=A0A5B7IAX4_PORTR|nr:hypothetical protein [Portunus trituberculatus]
MRALGSEGLQAHGFESCPRSECRLGILTRGNGFLAAPEEWLAFIMTLETVATATADEEIAVSVTLILAPEPHH